MTGAPFALRHLDESQKPPKAKCPFTPQREMIAKPWVPMAGKTFSRGIVLMIRPAKLKQEITPLPKNLWRYLSASRAI